MRYVVGILFLFCILVASEVLAGGWSPSRVQGERHLRVQKRALLIGVSHFRSRYWSPLKYTGTDIRRFGRVLHDEAGFQTTLLRTKKETTKHSIIQQIKAFGKTIKSSLDVVVVYVSSHGVVSPDLRGRGRYRYIVTSDTSQNIPKTAISVRTIRSLLQTFRSKRIVLVLATCYTGARGSKSVRPPGAKQSDQQPDRPMNESPAMQILSASSYAQPAFESERLKSDVYTHYLITCLKTLKRKKIAVSAIGAHICASTKTTQYVRKHLGLVQVPMAYSELGYNRDVYLVGEQVTTKKRAGSFRFIGAFWRAGRYLLRPILGRKGHEVIASVALRKRRVQLVPGRYQLIDTSGVRTSVVHEFLIESGKVVPYPKGSGLRLEALGGFLGMPLSGGVGLPGASVGGRFSFVGARLGVYGGEVPYAVSESSLNLLFELRVEAGFRPSLQRVELFVGGFTALDLFRQQSISSSVDHSTWSSLFHYGFTGSMYLKCSPRWYLVIQGDAGFLLYQDVNGPQHTFAWTLSGGISLQM